MRVADTVSAGERSDESALRLGPSYQRHETFAFGRFAGVDEAEPAELAKVPTTMVGAHNLMSAKRKLVQAFTCALVRFRARQTP